MILDQEPVTSWAGRMILRARATPVLLNQFDFIFYSGAPEVEL